MLINYRPHCSMLIKCQIKWSMSFQYSTQCSPTCNKGRFGPPRYNFPPILFCTSIHIFYETKMIAIISVWVFLMQKCGIYTPRRRFDRHGSRFEFLSKFCSDYFLGTQNDNRHGIFPNGFFLPWKYTTFKIDILTQCR